MSTHFIQKPRLTWSSLSSNIQILDPGGMETSFPCCLVSKIQDFYRRGYTNSLSVLKECSANCVKSHPKQKRGT